MPLQLKLLASGNRKTKAFLKILNARTRKAANQLKMIRRLSFVPSFLWRESSLMSTCSKGLDEDEKAGLLTSRSSYLPYLPAFSCSGIKGVRLSLQRRYRTGFTPVSLFSLDLDQEHFFIFMLNQTL